MGLTRQTVHATVNRLAADGLLELAPGRLGKECNVTPR
jgi:DNA-binding GntR family transcriptional regulator